MADRVLEKIQEDIGKILRELGHLASNQSALHVKVDMVGSSLRKVTDDRMRDRFDIERYGRRIASMEHQIALMSERQDVPNWAPDPKEVTGTHDFNAIKAQFEELRSHVKEEEERKVQSGIWWRRQRWLWVFAIFALFLTSGVGGCVTYAVTRALAPSAGK